MEENRIPFIALRGQTFLPGTMVGFDIGRDKSLAAVDAAMNGDKYLVVASQKDASVNDPGPDDCYRTGVLIRMKQVVKRHEEYVRVLVECKTRVRVTEIFDDGKMLSCEYIEAPDSDNDPEDINLQALLRVLKQTYLKYVELSNSGEAAARALIEGIEDASLLCNIICGEVDIDFELKQTLLELSLIHI